MKNLLSKIYLHPIFIITLFIFVLIGRFKFILFFMLLILVHEFGHIIISLLFKWKIDKIIILPFGGLTKYNIKINTPLIEEFIVAISGVIFQFIFFKLIHDYIDYKYFTLINYFIIIFNLIPIYPLDGAKILNVFFNIITSFKNSLLLTVIVSYISIIALSILLFNINKLVVVVLIFLFIQVNKLYKEINFLFNKFLLERYLNEFIFKKIKIIKSINGMKRDFKHVLYEDGKYITEKQFLYQLFQKNIDNS